MRQPCGNGNAPHTYSVDGLDIVQGTEVGAEGTAERQSGSCLRRLKECRKHILALDNSLSFAPTRRGHVARLPQHMALNTEPPSSSPRWGIGPLGGGVNTGLLLCGDRRDATSTSVVPADQKRLLEARAPESRQ